MVSSGGGGRVYQPADCFSSQDASATTVCAMTQQLCTGRETSASEYTNGALGLAVDLGNAPCGSASFFNGSSRGRALIQQQPVQTKLLDGSSELLKVDGLSNVAVGPQTVTFHQVALLR
jgi:hypothetical protein